MRFAENAVPEERDRFLRNSPGFGPVSCLHARDVRFRRVSRGDSNETRRYRETQIKQRSQKGNGNHVSRRLLKRRQDTLRPLTLRWPCMTGAEMQLFRLSPSVWIKTRNITVSIVASITLFSIANYMRAIHGRRFGVISIEHHTFVACK